MAYRKMAPGEIIAVMLVVACSVGIMAGVKILGLFNYLLAEENRKKREAIQAASVQEKQTLSESDKGFYAVVTHSVEIHQNGQIIHEVDLDKDGDGVADFQAKFNGSASLLKGDKVSIVSLVRHPSFKLFKVLQSQKENF